MDEKKLQLLEETIKRFMDNYKETYEAVTSQHDWKNPFRDIIKKEIPELLTECANLTEPYEVVGSYGKGLWTAVPWIAVFDKRITRSAQKGVYIVYLLNKDTKELYLTLEIAATEVMGTKKTAEGTAVFTGVVGNKSPELKGKLQEKTREIRKIIPNHYFNADEKINSGSFGYDNGAVYYKKYASDKLPLGKEIVNDLNIMLDIYKEYYSRVVNNEVEEWYPTGEEYDPGITKEQWLSILRESKFMNPNWTGVLAAFYSVGGTSTCSQLGAIFNRTPMSISGNCTQLAKAVQEKTNCQVMTEDGKNKYWPILFVGKDANSDEPGRYVWKLRTELYEALTEFDIMRFLWKEGGEEMTISDKEAISKIKGYIASKGFSYDDGLIDNFFLSLKSKPFVILAGTSGTGKTRLVKLFSEAIGAHFQMVPVRPDWSDSTDLFGHVDLNGKYVPGAILRFVSEAQGNISEPYILCLDEMNLARVEYYFSDVLSVIETREIKDNDILSDYLVTAQQYGTDTDALDIYGEIVFPQNLYIVGTVNMDETTFPFSKKVLDRANTIEFNYVDLMPSVTEYIANANVQELPNSFLKTRYLLLSQCEDKEYITKICAELQSINRVLQRGNAHIGYRVRDEIVFYMLNNLHSDLLEEDDALDNEIMQKILPRIQGSSASVKEMLCELFKIFAGDYEGYQTQSDDTASKMFKKIQTSGAKYHKSAEKTAFMLRRFEEDGFTSYWL